MTYFDLTKTQEKTPPKKPLENTKKHTTGGSKAPSPRKRRKLRRTPKGAEPLPSVPSLGAETEKMRVTGHFWRWEDGG